MVAVLVRDHVGLGERARPRRRTAIVQLVEEAEVDVDVLVGRAVERPDVGRRPAPQPVLVEPVKKTVVAFVYCLPLSANEPFQYAWTLLTSPTMRQSWRAFASAPVLALGRDLRRRVAAADLLSVERAEVPGPLPPP